MYKNIKIRINVRLVAVYDEGCMKWPPALEMIPTANIGTDRKWSAPRCIGVQRRVATLERTRLWCQAGVCAALAPVLSIRRTRQNRRLVKHILLRLAVQAARSVRACPDATAPTAAPGGSRSRGM